MHAAARTLGAVNDVSAATHRYPWVVWTLPLLYAATARAVRALCRGLAGSVAAVLPVGDPAVLVGLLLLSAAYTVPQQRWVQVPRGLLCLALTHLVLLLQYVAAWAETHPAFEGSTWGFWGFSLPNCCLSVYVGGRATLWWACGGDVLTLRPFVWSLYVLSGPLLLVPQMCVLLATC